MGMQTNRLNVKAGVVKGSVIGTILGILLISDINKFVPAGVAFSAC